MEIGVDNVRRLYGMLCQRPLPHLAEVSYPMRTILDICTVLAIVTFTSCQNANWELSPGSPAYRDGFHDGCDSGRFYARNPFAHYTRDVPRAESDKDYDEGWRLGYEQCRAAEPKR